LQLKRIEEEEELRETTESRELPLSSEQGEAAAELQV